MAPRQAARLDRMRAAARFAFHALPSPMPASRRLPARASAMRLRSPLVHRRTRLVQRLSPACSQLVHRLSHRLIHAHRPAYPRLAHDLPTTCPRFIPSLSPDSSTGLSTASGTLVPARSTGCPPTCPQAARRCRQPRCEVRGRHPCPARLPPSDVNLRKLTSPLASRTFAGTRRESVRQPGFRAAAPPKGHTHKLSGKRTDRVGTHTRSPGCASGFSYSGERQ